MIDRDYCLSGGACNLFAARALQAETWLRGLLHPFPLSAEGGPPLRVERFPRTLSRVLGGVIHLLEFPRQFLDGLAVRA